MARSFCARQAMSTTGPHHGGIVGVACVLLFIKGHGVQSFDEVLKQRARDLRTEVASQLSGNKVVTHVPTGFTSIDNTFGGVRIGVATELLAHTGDGKSAFLRQLAEAGARAGAEVLWCCGEDPASATAERQLSGDCGIASNDMGRLDLSADELDRIDQAAEVAGAWAKRVRVVFESPSVSELLEIIDGWARDTSTARARLFLGDYAQIFGESRTLEDDIARLGVGLQQRAVAYRLASVIASQVKSDVIQRGRERWQNNKDITGIRPSLGDTEWCRRLEKSTKAVWSLIRPGRWQREWGEDVEDNTAELHVIKSNFGPMGFCKLGWNGPATRFENL